ncbi:DUF1501 domain-containing protein [Halomonas huangheensis]|uniref:DUF1501 domain-containing protein n=1 Tax=Halomonas huangheensis TaxID=1178482 RepID=W1NB01_9GAMM|nr:DUF1501 domain-containing protein [Halomonas huangheensis]ALM53738.1 hypothetical protein AR456_16745 [Halomonas huangheensis]ERL52346.1 hypothetical protein BJB45_10290 [Halomonas huangheensis]
MLTRRQFLARLSAGTSLLLWPGLTTLANDASTSNQRLLVVLLRGAMDGLAAVPSYGEARFADLRGELALPTSGRDAVKRLDDTFAMHPSLAFCHHLYQRKQFGVVHACGLPYGGRSHFDAQDCLENGSDSPDGSRTGWLNRAVAEMQGVKGLSIASAKPIMVRGDAPFMTWSPTPKHASSPEALANRLADLYAEDEALAGVFAQALSAQQIVPDGESRGGQLANIMQSAGNFMTAEDAPRVVMVQDTGWDTHASQNAALGRKLAQLDSGIQQLHDSLGDHWQHTAVVVVTEFGRTVGINGSQGTDHGTASTVLLAGGAIRGGKVHGDWPGLNQLKDNRDLVTAQDVRSVLKGVLRDHMHIDARALDNRVFPDSRDVAAMEGLVG